MNQVKKRKPYQQPQIRVVEVSEAVAMLNANSGKATIGDLNYGGDLGGNASGGAKENNSAWIEEPLFETSHNKVWDE